MKCVGPSQRNLQSAVQSHVGWFVQFAGMLKRKQLAPDSRRDIHAHPVKELERVYRGELLQGLKAHHRLSLAREGWVAKQPISRGYSVQEISLN